MKIRCKTSITKQKVQHANTAAQSDAGHKSGDTNRSTVDGPKSLISTLSKYSANPVHN